MPVIAEDSFEAAVVGQAPEPRWVTHVPTAGAVVIANDPAPTPTKGKVLRISEGAGSTADYSEAKLPFPHPYAAFTWVFEFWAAQGTKTLYFGVYSGATRYDILKLSSSGTIQYRRGSDSTWQPLPTGANYFANTAWKRLRIVVNRSAAAGELAELCQDDNDLITAALDTPAIAGDIDAVAFATDSAEDVCDFYINNAQVLERNAILSDVVRDQNRAPIAGARVVAVRQVKQVSAGMSALTNAYGVYTLTVPSGLFYVVTAFHGTLNTYGGSAAAWVWAGGN